MQFAINRRWLTTKKFYIIGSIVLLLLLTVFLVNMVVTPKKQVFYKTPQEAISAYKEKDSPYEYNILDQLEINQKTLIFVTVVMESSDDRAFTALTLNHENEGYYVIKQIPSVSLKSTGKVTVKFDFENHKINCQIGQLNDSTENPADLFQGMKEYNDHIFFSYQS